MAAASATATTIPPIIQEFMTGVYGPEADVADSEKWGTHTYSVAGKSIDVMTDRFGGLHVVAKEAEIERRICSDVQGRVAELVERIGREGGFKSVWVKTPMDAPQFLLTSLVPEDWPAFKPGVSVRNRDYKEAQEYHWRHVSADECQIPTGAFANFSGGGALVISKDDGVSERLYVPLVKAGTRPYTLPLGNAELGETPEEAAIAETLEELFGLEPRNEGIQATAEKVGLVVEGMLGVFHFQRNPICPSSQHHFRMSIQRGHDLPPFKTSAEIGSIVMFPVDALAAHDPEANVTADNPRAKNLLVMIDADGLEQSYEIAVGVNQLAATILHNRHFTKVVDKTWLQGFAPGALAAAGAVE